MGFPGGTLFCDVDCTYDTAACDIPLSCGNGVVDTPESCDGSDLDDQTCLTLGYSGGELSCTLACTFDPAGCSGCIDGDADGHAAYDAISCPTGDDECDSDPHNWTTTGCTSCVDGDGDGHGASCDLGEDCDDGDQSIWINCGPASLIRKYLCSVRTAYRILAAEGEGQERRNQLTHPPYVKPELLATGPNQVWSWDITKLKGPVKWTYFYLYVMLDIFSRYVVGWMVAPRESAAHAKRLIGESCEKEGIKQGQLIIHSDRGSPMKAKTTGQFLADLGVTKSHSRPHVSDDNPFSEAGFKTLKYRPGFPDRFGCQQDSLAWCRVFFSWYNQVHRHSGIAMLTPEVVHRGQAEAVLGQRHQVALAAYQAHPERFVNGPPRLIAAPHEVWINPPQQPVVSTEGELH